jgi:ubiquinone/menaquinone biosynthesis C-methylase UbiE
MASPDPAPHPVAAHYTSHSQLERILTALAQEGHDLDALDPEALGTFEDFHTMGRLATHELAELADVRDTDHVLDLGSGIGGPARFLARTFGCHVTGIDLTPELCAVARELDERTGMDGLVTIDEGDVTDLPYDDATFDLVWTQHVMMNVADKATAYREAHRVLKATGRFAMFDIVATDERGPSFPVPWADEPSVSHLVRADEVRTLLEAAGFAIALEQDPSEQAAAFFRSMAAAPPSGPLNVGLLIPGFPEKAINLASGFEEGRIRLLRLLAVA